MPQAYGTSYERASTEVTVSLWLLAGAGVGVTIGAEGDEMNMMDLVEFEPVVVSAPPSLALEGIERYLRVTNNRLAITVPHGKASEPHALAMTCVALVATHSHPNKAVVSRFHDRIELEWHTDDASCSDLSGRLTIRPLAGKTELLFKGRCGFDDRTARRIVSSVLGQFKVALETEFETVKDFIHARERETMAGVS